MLLAHAETLGIFLLPQPIMSFTSSLDPNKDHPYHPLPHDSESLSSPSSARVLHLKDESRKGGSATSLEAIEDESQYQKNLSSSSEGSSYSLRRNVRLNKYALAGAILASTNSVLLGYGEFFSFLNSNQTISRILNFPTCQTIHILPKKSNLEITCTYDILAPSNFVLLDHGEFPFLNPNQPCQKFKIFPLPKQNPDTNS